MVESVCREGRKHRTGDHGDATVLELRVRNEGIGRDLFERRWCTTRHHEGGGRARNRDEKKKCGTHVWYVYTKPRGRRDRNSDVALPAFPHGVVPSRDSPARARGWGGIRSISPGRVGAAHTTFSRRGFAVSSSSCRARGIESVSSYQTETGRLVDPRSGHQSHRQRRVGDGRDADRPPSSPTPSGRT